MSTNKYGEYVLGTGATIASWENAFNRYLFESRFRGRAPILDLGPGRCAFTRQDPTRIVAVDNSPEIVSRYRGERLDVRLGSAAALPFEDNYFEGVYASWILEHLTDPSDCMREIHRTLRPGGYFLALVPSVSTLTRGFYDDYTHVRPFTPASLSQLAAGSGFERFRAVSLFWTRGLRRLLPLIGENAVVAILSALDRSRPFSPSNQFSLILEGWK